MAPRPEAQDHPLLKLLTRVSPSLAAAGNFAFSGAAFAIGNLLLARQMGTEAYASLTLCTAVFVVASQVATLGFSQLAQRQVLPDGATLFLRLLLQGAGFGLLAAALVHWQYGVSGQTAFWLVLVVAAGAIIWVMGSVLLREGRRGWAFAIHTLPDWTLLALGVAALVAPRWADSAFAAWSLVAGLAALFAWRVQARLAPTPAGQGQPVPWPLLWSTTAIVGGGILLGQIERLAVGFLLGDEELAMLGVLTSIAVFAFRLVNTGAGYVLTPGLRRIADVEGRRRLVRHELRVLAGVLVLATAGICLLGAPVARWMTDDRYQPTLWLLLVACLAGAAKVLHGIPRAIILGCGTDEELGRLSRFVWLGVLFGAIGAMAGAGHGLIGLLLGVAAGSLLGAVPGALLARRVLYRMPPPAVEQGA